MLLRLHERDDPRFEFGAIAVQVDHRIAHPPRVDVGQLVDEGLYRPSKGLRERLCLFRSHVVALKGAL